jgi:hypothetical protein
MFRAFRQLNRPSNRKRRQRVTCPNRRFQKHHAFLLVRLVLPQPFGTFPFENAQGCPPVLFAVLLPLIGYQIIPQEYYDPGDAFLWFPSREACSGATDFSVEIHRAFRERYLDFPGSLASQRAFEGASLSSVFSFTGHSFNDYVKMCPELDNGREMGILAFWPGLKEAPIRPDLRKVEGLVLTLAELSPNTELTGRGHFGVFLSGVVLACTGGLARPQRSPET